MSDGWHRVSDVARFLAEKGERRVRDHSFTKRVLNWPYCAHCGLLALKNKRSRQAMAEKCVTYE